MSPEPEPSPKSIEYPALMTVPEKCTASGVAPETGEAEKDELVACWTIVKGAETAGAWMVRSVPAAQGSSGGMVQLRESLVSSWELLPTPLSLLPSEGVTLAGHTSRRTLESSGAKSESHDTAMAAPASTERPVEGIETEMEAVPVSSITSIPKLWRVCLPRRLLQVEQLGTAFWSLAV